MPTKRRVGGFDNTPISTYWVFTLPSEESAEKMKPEQLAKYKKITKGQTWVAKYSWTFVNEATNPNDRPRMTHLLKFVDGRKETIPGSAGINRDLALLQKGTEVEITYVGKGKAKKGQRAPYQFTVDELIYDEIERPKTTKPAPVKAEVNNSDDTNAPSDDSGDEAEEEFSEPLPF